MLPKFRYLTLRYYKKRLFDIFAVQEKDHFFLAVPVLLAIGIAIYFGMTTEIPIWVGLTFLFISGVTTYYLRHYYIVFLSTLALTIVFVGFSSAQLRTTYLSTNILPKSFGPAGIQGRIVSVTKTQKGSKILLEDLQISRLRADHVPTRLRLHVNNLKEQIKTGQWIETWAMLKPPPQPSSPYAFDFQRHAYFQKIGAVGFTYGDIRIISSPEPHWLSYFDHLRHKTEEKIEKAFEQIGRSDQKTLAIAFLTGNKQIIDEETHEIVRAAGLAHLLAISGLHIGLVSAIAFFSLRSLLAFIPPLALRYPIKKWAAVFAILSALVFTLITGGSTPTLRAFLMTSIVLVGVLIDRKAISLRTVAWAAIVILLVLPESLLGASFQLSFAAVTALVAYYENTQNNFKQHKVIQYVKGIFTSSLIATLATTPFAAYHFNRIALYGIASNLLAIPITVFWIMPFGLLSLCLMPFGFEKYSLFIMGWGIEALLWVANTTANIPYAQISVPYMGAGAIVLITFGGLFLCLFKYSLRKIAFPLIACGVALSVFLPSPDIVINSNGKLSAIQSKNGQAYLSNLRYARYTQDSWLRSWGLEEHKPQAFDEKLPCDTFGCRYTHPNGLVIGFNKSSLALEEDCLKTDILITPLSSPLSCTRPRHIIDQHSLSQNGAHAVYLKDKQIIIKTVRDIRGNRPWTNYGE